MIYVIHEGKVYRKYPDDTGLLFISKPDNCYVYYANGNSPRRWYHTHYNESQRNWINPEDVPDDIRTLALLLP